MPTFPVLASTLAETALGDFIKAQYNLHEAFRCKLFRTGVNHSYFISDKSTRYVVRVYCHNWRTKTEIQEELKLLLQLKEQGLPVSYPVPNKEGKLIQEVVAPEGLRYVVLFTFAEGKKLRELSNESCAAIGSLIAKMHNITANQEIDRVHYTPKVLLEDSYTQLKAFFSEDLSEMHYLKEANRKISSAFSKMKDLGLREGIVHLDIWYDNLSVKSETEITLFDFDNCGKGFLLLDLAYFCKQLFFIEADKKVYESKKASFIEGYRKLRSVSDQELEFMPEAGASIFVFYLGVQASRFDWSNIFLSENYLKMFVGRIRSWLDYYQQ